MMIEICLSDFIIAHFTFSINYFDFDKTGTYINMYVLKYSGMTHTLDLSN